MIILLSLLGIGCGCFGALPSKSQYGPEAIQARRLADPMRANLEQGERLDVLIQTTAEANRPQPAHMFKKKKKRITWQSCKSSCSIQ